MNDKKLEYVSCNLCDIDDSVFVCSYGDGVNIVKCNSCGLVYRNPRLKECLNREFYSTEYYGNYTEIEEEISSARMRLFKVFLEKIEHRVEGKAEKLLDIGCGQGNFLKIAKENGWEVEGIELSESACRYAKDNFGIDIRNKQLNEAAFPDDYFDAVTMWNVLDHLTYPVDTLKEVRRILKPGGLLIIRVPNVNLHVFAHRIFNYIRLSDPSVVANYGFNKNTIKKILKKTKFQDIEIYNSPVSFGDPYKIFKKYSQYIVNSVKLSYYYLSNLVLCITFRQFIIGPSLLVYAKNEY